MPIICDIPLSLDINEVLRRQGIKEYSKLKEETKALIQELMRSAQKDNFLQPAIAYEIYIITKLNRNRVYLEGNMALDGTLFSSVISSAKELAIAVCTIGCKLEEKVSDYFSKNEPLRGLLLDGIGSAAVDSLAQEVCKLIALEAAARGYQASSPLSPGMHGFPLSEQQQIFRLVPAGKIGVSLTESGVMVPRKSISMVMGLGTRMRTWGQTEVCARCKLKKTCRYKIQT